MRDAHWIRKTHLFRGDVFICSACGAHSEIPYLYCPSCGWPMEETSYDVSWVDEVESLSALLDDNW